MLESVERKVGYKQAPNNEIIDMYPLKKGGFVLWK